MKLFYKKLIEKLTTPEAKQKFIDTKLPALRLIDFYRQQYLIQEKFDLLPLPAVLLEYNIVYPQEKNKSADVNINLHLCYEQLRDTSNVSAAIDDSLLFFDFIDVIYDLVNGLESDYTGKLQLIGENINKNDAIINVHLLNFTASYSGRLTNDKYDFTEENTSDLEIDLKLVEEEKYIFD